jgi:ethanolamine utilization cobalamin adenosyltransferase
MEMDIEAGNYIIPSELQNETRLTIPLVVEVASSNKFMMKDWRKVNDFVKNNLSKEQLLDRIKTGSF